MGCRGGTRTKEGKLSPQSERRLCGNDFWCGKNGRHFMVSNDVPSERSVGGQMAAEERKGDDGGPGTPSTRAEEGAEIWVNGQLLEQGRINDFIIVLNVGGKVHHHLLRDGSSCWLGEGEGPKIKWSGSGAWCFGRLKAESGFLSLATERPALVRGLEEAEGVGSSSAPTTFQIQQTSFRILGAEFSCHRVCFSPNRFFFLLGIGY